MLTLDHIRQHRDDLLGLANRHRAISLRIFGSALRGDDHAGSDIDLLVEFAPDASLLDLVGLKQDAEALLGRRVDIVTPDGVSPFLRQRILEEARPL